MGTPPPIAPQKWTRGKERIMVLARLEFILLLSGAESATGEETEYQ